MRTGHSDDTADVGVSASHSLDTRARIPSLRHHQAGFLPSSAAPQESPEKAQSAVNAESSQGLIPAHLIRSPMGRSAKFPDRSCLSCQSVPCTGASGDHVTAGQLLAEI